MKTVEKSATIPESRLSQQIGTNDDVVAIEEEVQEQIEEDNVERAARENATGVPVPIVRSNKEVETADDAVASREEVEKQAEESRIDKVAFEDGISTASAKEYIRRGRDHD
jgi:NCAIR mutase (PurE)-related protein